MAVQYMKARSNKIHSAWNSRCVTERGERRKGGKGKGDEGVSGTGKCRRGGREEGLKKERKVLVL
jgi:hypothetical protein